MTNPFTMDFAVENHTAADLFERLSAVKKIEKMKLNVARKNQLWVEYWRNATFSQNPFRVVVAFQDLEGGGAKVVVSSMMQQAFGNDRGQNERNCQEIRDELARLLG
jgi:hypothetical protein